MLARDAHRLYGRCMTHAAFTPAVITRRLLGTSGVIPGGQSPAAVSTIYRTCEIVPAPIPPALNLRLFHLLGTPLMAGFGDTSDARRFAVMSAGRAGTVFHWRRHGFVPMEGTLSAVRMARTMPVLVLRTATADEIAHTKAWCAGTAWEKKQGHTPTSPDTTTDGKGASLRNADLVLRNYFLPDRYAAMELVATDTDGGSLHPWVGTEVTRHFLGVAQEVTPAWTWHLLASGLLMVEDGSSTAPLDAVRRHLRSVALLNRLEPHWPMKRTTMTADEARFHHAVHRASVDHLETALRLLSDTDRPEVQHLAADILLEQAMYLDRLNDPRNETIYDVAAQRMEAVGDSVGVALARFGLFAVQLAREAEGLQRVLTAMRPGKPVQLHTS